MYESLLAFSVFLWLAITVLYMRSGIATIYHPVTYYLFFHGFIFVFRPILAYIENFRSVYRIYHFEADLDVKVMTLIVVNLGFVAFTAAALRVGNAKLVLRPTADARYDEQRSKRWFLIPSAIVLAPVGLAAMAYWYRIAEGGEFTMVVDAGSHQFVNTTSNGYFTTATDFIAALTILIAWQFRFRITALLPFIVYVMIRVASGGARWTFLLTTASLCMLFLYDKKKIWPNLRTMIVGVMVLIIFVVIGEQRDIVVSYINGVPIRNDLFKDRFLEGMDFANLEYVEYLVRAIPSKTGTYGYFLNNLQVLTEPIPRVLWPGKPAGEPFPMYDLWRYGTPIGMSSSLPGQGWAQLGLVGVAAWCALGGYVAGKFYNAFARSRQSAFQVGLYMMVLPMTVQIYRDGGLLTMLKFPMYFVVTVLVWKMFSIVLRRASSIPRTASDETDLVPSYTHDAAPSARPS